MIRNPTGARVATVILKRLGDTRAVEPETF